MVIQFSTKREIGQHFYHHTPPERRGCSWRYQVYQIVGRHGEYYDATPIAGAIFDTSLAALKEVYRLNGWQFKERSKP